MVIKLLIHANIVIQHANNALVNLIMNANNALKAIIYIILAVIKHVLKELMLILQKLFVRSVLIHAKLAHRLINAQVACKIITLILILVQTGNVLHNAQNTIIMIKILLNAYFVTLLV